MSHFDEGRGMEEIKLTVAKEQEEVAFVQTMLQRHHATMTYMKACYVAYFPEGTTQTPIPAASCYQEEALITFPDGATCRKVVQWPCVDKDCTHTWLVFEGEDALRSLRGRYANHKI